MFDWSRWSKLRPRSDFRQILRLVSVLCILAMLAPAAANVVGAQPMTEESPGRGHNPAATVPVSSQ